MRLENMSYNQGTVTLGHLKTPLNPNRNLHIFPPPRTPVTMLWVTELSLAGNQHCKVGEGGRGEED